MILDFDERIFRLFNEAPNSHVVNLFLYIAVNQPKDSIYGFRATKIRLQEALHMNRTCLFNSIKWLQDNLFIDEINLAEDFDFMVNPYIVMNSGDKEARIKEWSRRCRIKMTKELEKRKEKKRRELRRKNPQ